MSALLKSTAAGKLGFGTSPAPMAHFDMLVPPVVRAAPVGTVFEWRTTRRDESRQPVEAFRAAPALVIDYGHVAQRCRRHLSGDCPHSFADSLKTPGLADLTDAMSIFRRWRSPQKMPRATFGPVGQGTFLKELGIEARAATLMNKADATVIAISTARSNGLTVPGVLHGRIVQGARHQRSGYQRLPGLDESAAGGAETAMIVESTLLKAAPGVAPCIFHARRRRSQGIYAGLMRSRSNDDPGACSPKTAADGRYARGSALAIADAVQVHSPDVAVVNEPWGHHDSPKADALVTDRSGIALGITTAIAAPCCSPIRKAV